MSRFLVVVESPTKAKTISKILGKEYEVLSSKGHVIDLPESSLAVDIAEGFVPQYKVIKGKEKILKTLKEKAVAAQTVYIATDPDREGEAIGWHIKERLKAAAGKGKSKKKKTAADFYRVVFHEITEDAIKEAFTMPHEIDINKVNAQQARRVLDRIVGYFLSPLLWKKIVRGLSAGRVQSVALKFIVEREKEIRRFVPVKSFGVRARINKEKQEFEVKLVKYGMKKAPFADRQQAQEVVSLVQDKPFTVSGVEKKSSQRKPSSPFTTSLLQQESFNKYHFSSQKTMMLAQKLYEGIEIAEEMVGLITYMRTDSFHVSDKAKKEVKEYISGTFGKEFLPEKENKYKEKKGAQAAHEAIRPTSVWRTPDKVAGYLTPEEAKLYELIWKRFVSSFMEKACYENEKVTVRCGEAFFRAEGKKLVFEGYQRVYGRDQESLLPSLDQGEELSAGQVELTEHSTKPPARFTDASLVKLLEEKGIGRPSTYAPTIATVVRRDYVRREKGSLVPTDLGFQVSDMLTEHFSDIMDDTFTAQVEEKLDAVEDGALEWKKILEEFYPSFKEKVDKAQTVVKKKVVFTDELCPQCGRPLVIKWSRRGRFLSCSAFPECKFAKSITTDVVCPGCGQGKLIERKNKRGQRFYGCSRYPECTYTSRTLPKETEPKSQEA